MTHPDTLQISRAVVEQALEALNEAERRMQSIYPPCREVPAAITALRAALQPQWKTCARCTTPDFCTNTLRGCDIVESLESGIEPISGTVAPGLAEAALQPQAAPIGLQTQLLADFQELNLSNFTDDDVSGLNEWAIRAFHALSSRSLQPQAPAPNFCESCAMDLSTCDCVNPKPVYVAYAPTGGRTAIEVSRTLRHALSNVLQHAPKEIWPKYLAVRDECDAALAALQPQAAKPNAAFAHCLLSAAAKSGDPGAIALAAQLAGAPPCKDCGYVVQHCRCAEQAAAEPVAYEFRMRADWVADWGMWSPCNKEHHEMYIRAPKLHDWHYETRALYTSPPDHTKAMRLALSMLHFMNDNGYRLEEYEQGRMDAAIAQLETLGE